jgi:hypothetical protein
MSPHLAQKVLVVVRYNILEKVVRYNIGERCSVLHDEAVPI